MDESSLITFVAHQVREMGARKSNLGSKIHQIDRQHRRPFLGDGTPINWTAEEASRKESASPAGAALMEITEWGPTYARLTNEIHCAAQRIKSNQIRAAEIKSPRQKQ